MKAREIEAMPLVKRTPRVLEIDCCDLTNRVTISWVFVMCGASGMGLLPAAVGISWRWSPLEDPAVPATSPDRQCGGDSASP